MEKALTLTPGPEPAQNTQPGPPPSAPPPPHQQQEPAPDDLFDWPKLRDYALYLVGAPRRHPWLAAGALGAVLAAALLSLWALPRSYRVETKILTEKNQVMPALGNPNRSIPREADAPTRAASDTVLRRDNLVALIRQTDLLESWERTRAPAVRLKDGLVRLFKGPPEPEDRLDALVGLLEKRLWVMTGEGTVSIGIDWPDGEMAYHLVEAAQQNFLETRHAMEVSTIAEAISILEGYAQAAHDSVLASLDAVKKAREGRPRSAEAALARQLAPPQARVSPENQDLAQIKVMILAKRRAVADLEQFRQKRLAELQTQMAEQRAVYAPAHPAVVSIKQSIDALVRESPQIAALRKEEQELLAEFVRRGGRGGDDLPAISPQPIPERALVINNSRDEDDNVSYPREQLKMGIKKYQELLDRIEAARIELDTARAAFKYRYSIVRPAQVPKKATKPNVPLTLAGGLLAGLALAFVVPTLLDVYRRRIVQAWQVERQLRLPVLLQTQAPEAPQKGEA
jgi:uncharacterized protein involved in exopolysaccharide biosynthesis